MDMPRPSNSNDPYLALGCLRCLMGSLVCRALTNVGSKQCNLMGDGYTNWKSTAQLPCVGFLGWAYYTTYSSGSCAI